MRRFWHVLAAMGVAFVLAGCAMSPAAPKESATPAEPAEAAAEEEETSEEATPEAEAESEVTGAEPEEMEVPEEAEDSEAPSVSIYAGGYHRQDGPEDARLLIREDGGFILFQEDGSGTVVWDVEGRLRIAEEKEGSGGTRVDLYNLFDERILSFYDEGETFLEVSAPGSSESVRYEREDPEVPYDTPPLPAYSYAGDDPYLAAIIADYLPENAAMYRDSDVFIPAPAVFLTDASDPEDIKVFGNFWIYGYDLYGDVLAMTGGGEMPACYHLKREEDGTVTITEVERAGDGAEYMADIERFTEGYPGLAGIYANSYDRCRTALDEQLRAYVEASGLQIRAVAEYGWSPRRIP